MSYLRQSNSQKENRMVVTTDWEEGEMGEVMVKGYEVLVL